ncbi:MAG TPA: DUF177 domain-containing protein [Terriglobia bacterium]|nr:DUF177 domain-containing protein [Terriglobia bacterium]
MTRYVVDLKDLEAGKIALDGRLEPGEIDFSPEGVRQVGPLAWKLGAEKAGDEIRITGSIETVIDTTCSRCLEPARVNVARSFDLFFLERDRQMFDEDVEVELGEEDTRTAFFSGTELQIADILREQVLLALPMKALCALDCKGLCPECGANLNVNACGCARERFSPHMDQLLEIKRKLEERSS